MDRKSPTLSDVARCAGVSYATADRVVNKRGGVAEKSVRCVLKAIRDLGYVRNVAAANLSQSRSYRFGFVIPVGTNAFFEHVRAILTEAQARLLPERINLQVEGVEAFDPAALRTCLEAFAADDIDGIALVGSDGEGVQDAISDLRARGVGVLTLITDVTGGNRDAYIGIDNVVAGQTAGRMIALAHGGRGGRVLPVAGSLGARDHAERLAGMTQTLETAGASFSVAENIEGFDQHDIVEQKLRAVLAADPEITAIYNAGAGNAGLVRVLETLGTERPIVVLHELVAHSRRALEKNLVDIVIDQRPDEEIARALRNLRRLADRRDIADPDPIVPAIYVKENLPSEPVLPPREGPP